MPFFRDNKLVRILLPVVTAILVFGALYYHNYSSKAPSSAFEESFGPVMGTTGHVTINQSDSLKIPAQDAFTTAYSEIKYVETLLSRFNPKSDITRINNAAAGEKVKVDPITWRVLLESRRFYQLSDKAFDPTIGSLVKIYPWKETKISALPSKQIISEALKHTGFDKLQFIREGMYIVKTDSDLKLDLGGIAKGFGVYVFASKLKEAGVSSAIVEIGGEITLIGSPDITKKSNQTIGEDKKIWTTGIRNPRGTGLITHISTQPNASVATSGDYEKYFEIAGKRYSHILDPRTGLPTTSGIISVTIVTKRSCTIADALATAVSVLDIERSKELLKLFPETKAFLILEDMSEVSIEGGLIAYNKIEVLTE